MVGTFHTMQAFSCNSVGKNLPAMQETQVRSLGREDPLEENMVTHSSILAWRIPRIEEPGRPQSIESQESDMTWRLNHHHQRKYPQLRLS